MQNKKTKAETLIKELDPRLKDGKRYNLYYGLCKQNGRRSIDGTICYNETKTEILQTLAEELLTLKIDEFGAEALTICRITPHGFFADNVQAGQQVWKTVNLLLRLDRDWKV